MTMPRLYHDLAGWFHLLTPPEEYEEEAASYRDLLLGAKADARTLLELGSGGGNNASFLKRTFRCTLTDLSPDMLEISHALNPECEHALGDMRTLRLGRTFDAVFVHDAIGYLTELDDLEQVTATAAAHLGTGGVVLFVPDCTRETFVPATRSGGSDGGPRGIRYVEWTTDPKPDDHRYDADFAYLLRGPDGSVSAVHDHHELGLFSVDEWLACLASAGFEARAVSGDDPEYPGPRFVGIKRQPAEVSAASRRAPTTG